MALAEATELAALEKEALEFFLEEEEREKQELKQALRVQENRGKAFHEVTTLHNTHTCSYMYITVYYTCTFAG